MSTPSNPLVSVAVVTYQHRQFIGDCLDSILSQDYLPIEIVVADDGSTDGTQEIIREYSSKHPGKFVLKLSSANRGITVNCNEALRGCSGKYIAWMGGDDLMMEGKIRRQVEYMERNPKCSILYHNVEVFDSATKQAIGKFNSRWNAHRGEARVAIRYGTFNCACSNMVRSLKSPANGFDSELPVASDWLYWVEVLLNGGTIEYLPLTLGKYRRHSSNVTSKGSAYYLQALNDHLRACEKILVRSPHLRRDVRYRLSVIYRMRRFGEYIPSLLKSLGFNLWNWRSWAMLFIYCISLGRLKY